MDNKATREGFGAAIQEIGKDKDIVVLDADLSGSTKSKLFGKLYPDRFFNVGISEQDLIGTAAGFASCGKIPFACSFAIFITGNAYQQIRMQAGLSKLNIKIIGSHSGILTGEDGASHQALEDISMMRIIPGMTVIQPADYNEAIAATKAIHKFKGPCYLRLGRGKVPIIYKDNYKFEIGKADILKKGKDVSIFATGSLVNEALNAADMLANEGIDAEVINVSTLWPIDKDTIIKSAKKTNKVVTCEDHSIYGGLGTIVQEVLSDTFPMHVIKIGMSSFGGSGTGKALYEKYGLTANDIFNKAK